MHFETKEETALAGEVAAVFFTGEKLATLDLATLDLATLDADVVTDGNGPGMGNESTTKLVVGLQRTTHKDFAQHAEQIAPQVFGNRVQAATKARGAQIMFEIAVRNQKATSQSQVAAKESCCDQRRSHDLSG